VPDSNDIKPEKIINTKESFREKIILDWVILRSLQTTRLAKAMTIWLIIVPILAKSLSTIDKLIKFDYQQYTFEICTKLPFSWQWLYWAAVFFTLGNILVQMCTPAIIKENKNFNDFIETRKGFLDLRRYNYFLKAPTNITFEKIHNEFIENNYNNMLGNIDEKKTFISDNIEDGFHSLFTYARSDYRSELRLAITIIYCFAFLFILVVAYENARWVFDKTSIELLLSIFRPLPT
jgi:hypothetical protein